VSALNPKALKTQHTNPDFGLIKQIRVFIRKFSGSQIQAGDYPFLKFIFCKSTAGGYETLNLFTFL
jgi:hypothetical protein